MNSIHWKDISAVVQLLRNHKFAFRQGTTVGIKAGKTAASSDGTALAGSQLESDLPRHVACVYISGGNGVFKLQQ